MIIGEDAKVTKHNDTLQLNISCVPIYDYEKQRKCFCKPERVYYYFSDTLARKTMPRRSILAGQTYAQFPHPSQRSALS